MSSPLFSVVIPVYNAENTIGAAIASLQAQSLGDWEALIVDDASTDRSLEVVLALAAADQRLRVIHDMHQDAFRGVSVARNTGIDHARGQYIAFLDADDRWYPDKLARQREAFGNGADIVFCSYRRVDLFGKDLGLVPARPVVRWAHALSGNPIGCLTGAYRRERFEQARMPDVTMHEDYAFWLHLLAQGEQAVGLPDVLAEYTVSPGSRSANKFKAALAVWEILGGQRLSFWRRLYCFCAYAFKAVKRRV